jgi:hypothetical protein
MFACASSLDGASLPSELPSLADLEVVFVGFSGDDRMGANGNGEEERCVAGEEMPKSKPASEAELWLSLPLDFLFSGCSSAGLASSFAGSVLVSNRDATSRAAFKLDVDCLDCVTSPPACDVEYFDDV